MPTSFLQSNGSFRCFSAFGAGIPACVHFSTAHCSSYYGLGMSSLTEYHWARRHSLTQHGLLTGLLICLVTAVVAARQARRRTGSPTISLNAVSHWIWGDHAAYREALSVKYTLTGFIIHFFASVFWAIIFERAWGRDAECGSVRRALAGAGAIAATSYVSDYGIAPRRLTPGWDLRLSRRDLAAIYTSIALVLPLRGLASRTLRHANRVPGLKGPGYHQEENRDKRQESGNAQ